MLIIGAKGFAKELLQILYVNSYGRSIYFYDDINEDVPSPLFNKYIVIRDTDAAKQLFQHQPEFCLGIGDPKLRYKLAEKFSAIGGTLTSVISSDAKIGNFNNSIGEGTVICGGTQITNDIIIGKGCLINLNCTVGHDVVIGDYCELSPGVHISGNVKVGNTTSIGTGAVVLPKVILGSNVTVGAGAVVSKNVEDNTVVVGIPAKPLQK